MKPGSYAIICRDINQFDLIAEKAALRDLKVISYGSQKMPTCVYSHMRKVLQRYPLITKSSL